MELVSVAAVAENGVIGNDGELPWPSIPADKRQYRGRVAGSPVVLGRRTFKSMREDLLDLGDDICHVHDSLKESLEADVDVTTDAF